MTVVPVCAPIAPDMLERHRRIRLDVRDQLSNAEPEVGVVFRWWARRRMIESMGNLFLDDRPLLIPPRRRYLHDRFNSRLAGCDAAFRHVDARIEMFRRRHVEFLVGPETPFVIHALVESRDPDRIETNPGLPRLTESRFDETQTEFVPPPGALCEELMRAAVDIANVEAIPAIVRAGWLCATTLAIHPFVDGNGRTARLLFQFVASSDQELGTDWGALEQWAMHRVPYVRALKASQAPSIPTYDGHLIDTAPFIEFGLRSSIEGAEVVSQRLAWFERSWDQLLGSAGSESCAVLELAVASAWSASIDEVDELLGGSATLVVNELVRANRLVWDQRGLLRLAPMHPLTRER